MYIQSLLKNATALLILITSQLIASSLRKLRKLIPDEGIEPVEVASCSVSLVGVTLSNDATSEGDDVICEVITSVAEDGVLVLVSKLEGVVCWTLWLLSVTDAGIDSTVQQTHCYHLHPVIKSVVAGIFKHLHFTG